MAFAPDALLYFRRFFALKLFVFYFHTRAPVSSAGYLLMLSLVAIGAALAVSRTRHRAGLCLLLIYYISKIATSLVGTPNHHYVECLFLVALLTFQTEKDPSRARRPDVLESEKLCCQVLQASILII